MHFLQMASMRRTLAVFLLLVSPLALGVGCGPQELVILGDDDGGGSDVGVGVGVGVGAGDGDSVGAGVGVGHSVGVGGGVGVSGSDGVGVGVVASPPGHSLGGMLGLTHLIPRVDWPQRLRSRKSGKLSRTRGMSVV